jgi:hypothetical protein
MISPWQSEGELVGIGQALESAHSLPTGALQLGAAEELAAQAREIQDERDALRHHEERARRLESAVQMYAKQVLANRSVPGAYCLLLTW